MDRERVFGKKESETQSVNRLGPQDLHFKQRNTEYSKEQPSEMQCVLNGEDWVEIKE